MELCDLTITEAQRGLREKKFSAKESTQSCLQRIDKLEDRLNAFISVTPIKALKQAEKVDGMISRGEELPSLAGIPIAIKDNICTKGICTTAASRILEDFIPPYDATVVAKLREQRAIFIGKTNLDEFAMGSSTENSAFGPTKNPWNTAKVAGGSSGGSAAAVASGMCLGALGSDTGGSIRQPASFCGVVGLKPTYGRVSRYGLIALTSSLDQIGPLARTAEDTSFIFEAIRGSDPSDATSISTEVGPLPRSNLKEGFRIGIPKEYFGEGLDSDVEEIIRKAIKVMENSGGKIVEISLPHTKDALPDYYIINPSEASANLARYDGVRYGVRIEGGDFLDEYFKSRSRGFGDEVKRRIMLGTYTLSAGYYEAFYLRASKVRTLVARDFEKAFAEVDVIACPTSPTIAFGIGEKQDPLSMYMADIFTIPANLAGICGINIPCGFSASLPVGLQLLGPQFSEELLFKAGYAFEQATDWHKKRTLFPEKLNI